MSATLLGWREFGSTPVKEADPTREMSALSEAVTAVPASIRGQYDLINRCRVSALSATGLLQDPAVRANLLEACAGHMRAILADSPGNAFAATALAEFGSRLKDPSMADALFLSQDIAPNEQWLAELRVRVFEDYANELPSTAQEREKKDIAILVLSSHGIRSMAQRYVRDPAFRERVVSVVETLPARDQNRFISAVNAAAQPFLR